MSSSIAIPKRKQLATPSIATSSSASSPAPGSYYSPLSATSSYASSLSPSSPGISGLEARRLGKSKAREGAAQDHRSWERRPSLLGLCDDMIQGFGVDGDGQASLSRRASILLSTLLPLMVRRDWYIVIIGRRHLLIMDR